MRARSFTEKDVNRVEEKMMQIFEDNPTPISYDLEEMKRFLEDPSTVKKNCKASLRYNSRRGIKVMNRRGKLKLKRLKMLWKNFGQNFQFSLEKDGNIQANLPSQFLLQTKLRHFRFGFKIVFQEAQCSRRERV